MIELNVKSIKFAVRTRAQRKAAMSVIIRQLTQIREAEINCLNNRPNNLRMTLSYYCGENAVESIDWALDFLKDVYISPSFVPVYDEPF